MCYEFGGHGPFTPGHAYGYKKRMEKRDQHLLDVQPSSDKKLATTQDRQTLQNSDEKRYCQYWMLRLVVPTNRDFLLKLCMLVESAKAISRVLTWKNMSTLGLPHVVS